MVLNNIEKLLEKYENGETSLIEEQQLKNYFSQQTVAPHLEMYTPIFQYFIADQKEQFTNNIKLNTKKKLNFKWLSVAAVAVVLVSVYFNGFFREVTISNQEQIDYNNAKFALNLVAKHYNKATAQVLYLDIINKAGTQVDYLKEINNPMGRILRNSNN